MKKRSTWMLAAATSAAAAAIVVPIPESAEASTTFPDLNLNTEVGKAIEKMVKLGVLAGFNDGTIRPNDPVTREQAAKILSYLHVKEVPTLESYYYENNYTDVKDSSWSSKYIAYVSNQGFMEGNSSKFNPSNVLTRGQMAVVLDRFLDLDEPTSSIAFEDVKEGAYYKDAVEKLVSNGITKGTSATKFSPEQEVTRGQLAVFFDRAGILDELLNSEQSISTANIQRGWIQGGVDEMMKYFDFTDYTDFYPYKFVETDLYLDFDESYPNGYKLDTYGYLGNTVVPMYLSKYNSYLDKTIELILDLEIDNGEVKAFRFITEEEMRELSAKSTGAKELQTYIENILLNYVDESELKNRHSYTGAASDTELQFVHKIENHLHFLYFTNLEPFLIYAGDYQTYDLRLLKITPTGLGENYDFTVEEAQPTYSIIEENVNNFDYIDFDYSELIVEYEFGSTEDENGNDQYTDFKIDVYNDKNDLKVGDYIHIKFFDREEEYGETEMDILYTDTYDLVKYTWNGSEWIKTTESNVETYNPFES